MIDYQVCHYRELISGVRKLPVLRGKIYFYMQIFVFISTSRGSTHRVEIDNFILIMIYYIIFSINFVKNNLFSQKLKQFLKLFFIYLSQNMYHYFCKDSICNDPKLVSGSNVKAQTIKFVERGCPRTRLTLKEKRLSLMFKNRLAQI